VKEPSFTFVADDFRIERTVIHLGNVFADICFDVLSGGTRETLGLIGVITLTTSDLAITQSTAQSVLDEVPGGTLLTMVQSQVELAVIDFMELGDFHTFLLFRIENETLFASETHALGMVGGGDLAVLDLGFNTFHVVIEGVVVMQIAYRTLESNRRRLAAG
jgi:hypothetical protein